MRKIERQRLLIRQFLLGEVEEESRQNLEERFMTDSEYRTEVLMVESELLDDYANGLLSDGEKAKFLEHYLTAPRQERKLRATQALSEIARATKLQIERPKARSWLARLFNSSNRPLQLVTVSLLAVALLAGGVVWRMQTQKTSLREELAQVNAPENIARLDGSILVVPFDPLTLREKGSWPKLTLSSDIKAIQLNVPVADGKYQAYRLDLRTVEGARVAEFEVNTKPQNGVLPVRLPSRILPATDYTLTIHGAQANGQVEGIGDYSFRVLPQ